MRVSARALNWGPFGPEREDCDEVTSSTGRSERRGKREKAAVGRERRERGKNENEW